MAELRVNGKPRTYTSDNLPSTLAELIVELNLKNISIVAEIDGKIIRKEGFTSTELADGMNIELVKFVGGG